MEWEFTPEQVVKGEVGYGLEGFRDDLAREVRDNMAGVPRAEQEQAFHVLYDLCHWLATGRDFEAFAAEFSESPLADAFLRTIRDPIAPNVEMLGAILQRLIMERVEAGLPLEQALNAAAEFHGATVRRHNPFASQAA
ncbi:MAG: hypothetical protein HYU77_00345 [Betaproteobacteria bacterium]|nr:hypothetical protein [Betaproteobacteria bacterium]